MKEEQQIENVRRAAMQVHELRISEKGTEKRRKFLQEINKFYPSYLYQEKNIESVTQFQPNIENFIGLAQLPVGISGPLHIHGDYANGEFYIPMATTEGALVGSYHRGAVTCSEAGGVTAKCIEEGVSRAPIFRFNNLQVLTQFLAFASQEEQKFEQIIRSKSRFAQLLHMKPVIEGNHLNLVFTYTTGDASGQNMVTICTEAICHHLVQHSPIQPEAWYIDGNLSGDKKATSNAFARTRGKRVTAEIEISSKILEQRVNVSPNQIVDCWRTNTMGALQTGSIGAQGHYANGLAAIFIATGQDAACVAESAVGVTRMEVNKTGDLYVSVTLPNLIVGTVGGGTHLPTQAECLQLMNCYGEGKANQFAEVIAASLLGGEISICAAIAAHDFTAAHRLLGRKKR